MSGIHRARGRWGHAGQTGRERDRRDPRPRARADDRQRVAGGRRHRADVRSARSS